MGIQDRDMKNKIELSGILMAYNIKKDDKANDDEFTQLAIKEMNVIASVKYDGYEKDIAKLVEGKTKTEAAKIVGAVAAERAMAKGVQAVVFDRGGYLYTGRVQAVADGAREAGLKF